MGILSVAVFGMTSWPIGSPASAVLVLGATSLLIAAAFVGKGSERTGDSLQTWAMVLTVCVFMLTCLPPINSLFDDSLPAGLRAVVGGSALISIAFSEKRRLRLQRAVGVVLIAIVGVSAVLLLSKNPDPKIDVIYGHRAAAEILFDGANPYADAIFPDTGPPYANQGSIRGYSYPPASMVPFSLSERVGDARWLSIAAVTAFAMIVVWFASAWTSHAVLLVGCVLTYPMLGSMIVNGWTEPLQLVLLVASGVVFTRPISSGAFGGLAVASKQYMVLALVPMLLVPDRGRMRRIAVVSAIMLTSLAPFVLWDPQASWDALVGIQLERIQRLDTLSVASFGLQVPIVVAAAAATVLAIVLGRRIRTSAALAIVQASSLASYFVLSSNSFRNYFWLVAMMTLFAVSDGRTPAIVWDSDGGVPQVVGSGAEIQ